MRTKKVKYNSNSINTLPNDKPVLYKIKTDGGKHNYVGTAKKGRVTKRIIEHIGKIPGASVQIEQFHSIQEAQKKESKVIPKLQPKYNKRGK